MTTSNFSLLDTSVLLYVIDSNDIDTYKHLAIKHLDALSNVIPNKKENFNIFVTVCDIWSALKSYEHTIFLDQNKCLSYPPAALQLNLIADNSTVQNFIQMEKLSLDEQFILSYFISAETMVWVRSLLQDAKLSHLIHHYVNEVDYFAMLRNTNETVFIQEINNQTNIVKAMMKNVRESNEFHFAIINAITKTKQFLPNMNH